MMHGSGPESLSWTVCALEREQWLEPVPSLQKMCRLMPSLREIQRVSWGIVARNVSNDGGRTLVQR